MTISEKIYITRPTKQISLYSVEQVCMEETREGVDKVPKECSLSHRRTEILRSCFSPRYLLATSVNYDNIGSTVYRQT